jgi:hypothetical protein
LGFSDLVRLAITYPIGCGLRAYVERFVRAIKEECLNKVIPLGERHLRRTMAEFVAHYHGERNHQGLGNELIDRLPQQPARGFVRRWQRLGGILSFYRRAAQLTASGNLGPSFETLRGQGACDHVRCNECGHRWSSTQP